MRMLICSFAGCSTELALRPQRSNGTTPKLACAIAGAWIGHMSYPRLVDRSDCQPFSAHANVLAVLQCHVYRCCHPHRSAGTNGRVWHFQEESVSGISKN